MSPLVGTTDGGQRFKKKAFICFFANAMLELLYIVDEDEARSPGVARTALWARSKGRACPIGICVRCVGDLPFSCWPYEPPYLPPGVSIMVADLAPEHPFIFVTPFATRAREGREITAVELGATDSMRSDTLDLLAANGVLSITSSETPRLRVAVDGGVSGGSLDLRPDRVALTLEW